MLQDPLDDNVVPVVEELQRRLPLVKPICQAQGEDEENLGPQNDLENSEENGITPHMILFSWYFTFLLVSWFKIENLLMDIKSMELVWWFHWFSKVLEFHLYFNWIHLDTFS